jgi:uncharacterized BrkB/YihY/UPF0761 family membrane protein
VPLSWSELARRTWREVVEDDVLGLAAQLSYYVFLALFPAMLFLLALASVFRRRPDRTLRASDLWTLAFAIVMPSSQSRSHARAPFRHDTDL